MLAAALPGMLAAALPPPPPPPPAAALPSGYRPGDGLSGEGSPEAGGWVGGGGSMAPAAAVSQLTAEAQEQLRALMRQEVQAAVQAILEFQASCFFRV